jgi:hypothetical protein
LCVLVIADAGDPGIACLEILGREKHCQNVGNYIPQQGPLLGVMIFWLDAVSRVVLVKVEQAACEKSQVRWAVCMQADQFQPIQLRTSIHVITQLVVQLVCMQ